MLGFRKALGTAGLLLLAVFVGLLSPAPIAAAANATPLIHLVNPFIGTASGGNTFPGATLPFGMAQLCPDMSPKRVNGGACYVYTLHHIDGFSMTHLSGTGCTNFGDVFFTATTGPLKTRAAQYHFSYSHKNETALPGYYQVFEKTWGVNAQLTTTLRCGMARFTFPAGKTANIIVPISHVMTNLSFPCHLKFVNHRLLTGYVTSDVFCSAWPPLPVFFAMQFSKAPKQLGMWKGGKISPGKMLANMKTQKPAIGAYVTYAASSRPQTIEVRVGISYISAKGALRNLKGEMKSWNFNRYRSTAEAVWNKALSVIKVSGGSHNHRVTFYTALYHALLNPTVFNDIDGRYIGYDNKIHHVAPGHKYMYANFSGWDIYRSEVPLLTVIEPKKLADMAQSIVEMAKQSGIIGRWPAANRPGAVMVGDPLSIVMATTWNAGIHNFDIKRAYTAMLHMAKLHHAKHFAASCNVASAEEYDVAFAALAGIARQLHHFREAAILTEWAQQYRVMYNPLTRFMQPRLANGAWVPIFEKTTWGPHYVEGTAWEYIWLVPQDVAGLVDLLGGNRPFCHRLDKFFNDNHYDAGNEPDLQAPFLFDYACEPWRTQAVAAAEADRCFTNTPGGLAGGGNDDCGEMSSWYVLSQLGLYMVDPGRPNTTWELCTPRFRKAVIKLGAPYAKGTFTITAAHAGGSNMYIHSTQLNGQPLNKPWIFSSAVVAGGTLHETLGKRPDKQWASAQAEVPPSMSTDTPANLLAINHGGAAWPQQNLILNSNPAAFNVGVPNISLVKLKSCGCIHNRLVLTGANSEEQTRAWFQQRVTVGGPWTLKFRYHLLKAGQGGFYVVVQNNRFTQHMPFRGQSAAAKGFTDDNGRAPRNSFGLGIDNNGKSVLQVAYSRGKVYGLTRKNIGSTGAVNFSAAGAPITVVVRYNGAKTIRFEAKRRSGRGASVFKASYTLPHQLSHILASMDGYVGFTASNGNSAAAQQIGAVRFYAQRLEPISARGYDANLLIKNTARLAGGSPLKHKYFSDTFDGGTVFYQAGLAGAPAGSGLPANGRIASLGTVFKLQPFGADNTVFLKAAGPKTGHLALTKPAPFTSLAILASSAYGNGIGNVTLHLRDQAGKALTVTTDYAAPDWYNNQSRGATPDGNGYGAAIRGIGKLKISDSRFSLNAHSSGEPAWYVTYLNMANLAGRIDGAAKVTRGLNLTKDTLESLTFNGPANKGGNTAIFAISGVKVGAPQPKIEQFGGRP